MRSREVVTLDDWNHTLYYRNRIGRGSTPEYTRRAALARRLTPDLINSCSDDGVLATTDSILKNLIPYRGGFRDGITPQQLGHFRCLIHNRRRALKTGTAYRVPRISGPKLDPTRLPDHRLDYLIQSHRDLSIVDDLRPVWSRI